MNPGDDCLDCHDDFVIAGTVYNDRHADAGAGVDGVTVRVVDADGRATTLTSNAAGNFYTSEHLQTPLSVQVERDGEAIPMTGTVTNGACNACHSDPGASGAPGRIYAP